jgi:diguanylate cyclase (GGDEF)-like protein/PAS domain S-box-containing protein
MTIRTRVNFLTATSVIILIVILAVASWAILLPSFRKLEQRYVSENVQRAEQAFYKELESVAKTASDWAHWNEYWDYALGNNPDFFHYNVGKDTLLLLNFNISAALDTSGRWLDIAAVDTDTGEDIPAPASLVEYLDNHPEFISHKNERDTKQSLVMLPTGPILLATAPIVKGDFSGPIAGTLLVARFVDESFIQDLGRLTKLDLELFRLDKRLSNEHGTARDKLLEGQGIYIRSSTRQQISGMTLLSDNQGNPQLLLDVNIPRTLYSQALTSLLTIVLLAVGLFVLSFYLLVHFSVLRGFGFLKASVGKVTRARDAKARVDVRGTDEFAELGHTINTMLATLEQTQSKLQESEARYALAVTGVNDGLWEWDIASDQMYFSARWMEMMGYEAKEHKAGSSFWSGHAHPDDLPRAFSELTRYLKGRSDFYEGEYRMRHQDGSYRWVLVRGVAERKSGRAIRMAGSLTDITKRGVFDSLTGLPNRQLMNEYLKHALSYSQRHTDAPAAVLFMDLNRFKEVNDSLGHQVGDLLLLEFAKRLQETLRGEDKIARLGGDEFVVLIEGLEEAAVIAVAERLSQESSRVYELNGQQIFSSSSIGIVTNLQRYETVSDILRDADIAMYRSKSRKVPYVVFDDDMFRQVSEKQKLETDLRQALEKRELFLLYQPVVDLTTQQVVGFEALLRWQRQGKVVSPLDFIPIAEETGLIVPIGAWVLGEACRQLKTWMHDFNRHDLHVAVNLSSRQLAHANLVSLIQDVLERSELPAQCLRLEITESAIIENQHVAAEVLHSLKAMGISFLMDDFGTGYSSLNYLTNLPIDGLKIDRSFISKLEHDPKILEVVRTIINLAHGVQTSVIAEGIETQTQASLLRSLGCGLGQGYLFAKPQHPDRVGQLLKLEPSPSQTPQTLQKTDAVRVL